MNKKIFSLVAPFLALGCHTFANAQELPKDPAGTIVYALPQTVISLEVHAVKEDFHAGPYARFAKKYLGADVRLSDESTCKVVAVNMVSYTEADPSKRFAIVPSGASISFLELTAEGLVSTGAGRSVDTKWRFAGNTKADFSDKGVNSNLTSESAVLYKNIKESGSYSTVAVQQQMVVEKTLEEKASEAAKMIFSLRQAKTDIVTGNTDATYSGEAMAAALAEITALEKEYMSLFIGYSDYQDQTMNYDVVPQQGNASQKYVAFRVSDRDGLVAADNMEGRPYMLELEAQEVKSPTLTESASAAKKVAYYRVPSVCAAKLTDGVNVLLQSRIPVYQLGVESTMPMGK